jgi:uncharacterized protein (TIGR00290 family)
MNQNALCSWSGGKDSCFALMQAIEQGYFPKVLLNVLNEEGKISRSHGIPYHILQEQANAADVFLHCISSSWQEYESRFTSALKDLKTGFNVDVAIFGDIDLQEHRDWEEKVCNNAGLTAVLPLWKEDRKQLAMRMLESGMEAMIVSCNEILGEGFLGKILTPSLISDLESMNIDPCGENGEYHTLVLNCPLFRYPVKASAARAVRHDNYWFSELA